MSPKHSVKGGTGMEAETTVVCAGAGEGLAGPYCERMYLLNSMFWMCSGHIKLVWLQGGGRINLACSSNTSSCSSVLFLHCSMRQGCLMFPALPVCLFLSLLQHLQHILFVIMWSIRRLNGIKIICIKSCMWIVFCYLSCVFSQVICA